MVRYLMVKLLLLVWYYLRKSGAIAMFCNNQEVSVQYYDAFRLLLIPGKFRSEFKDTRDSKWLYKTKEYAGVKFFMCKEIK